MNLQNFKINMKGFCSKAFSPAQLFLGYNCISLKTAWFTEYSLGFKKQIHFAYYLRAESLLLEVNLHSQRSLCELRGADRRTGLVCPPASTWESVFGPSSQTRA